VQNRITRSFLYDQLFPICLHRRAYEFLFGALLFCGTAHALAPRRGAAGGQLLRVLSCLWRLATCAVRWPLRPFLADVLTQIYLCGVCSCQILRHNGRG
jgi:hypothetical protein